MIVVSPLSFTVGNPSNLHMEEDVGVISKGEKAANPLKLLYQRLEEERHALIRQLKGKSLKLIQPHS